jgi:serine/threonine-protein kinase RsbW
VNEQRSFPNSPDSVTNARHYTLERLGDVPRDVADLVAVMTSELTTNSIRHAGTEFTVRVDRVDDHVRVAVTDHGPGEPVVRSPRPTEPTGRGLRIVRALADTWGIARTGRDGHKTVWFTVAVPDVASH